MIPAGVLASAQVAAGFSLPFSDNFNRADAPTLGAPWETLAGTVTVEGNRAKWATVAVSPTTEPGYMESMAVVDAGTPNVVVSALFPGVNIGANFRRIIVRYESMNTFYRLQRQDNTATVYLIRNTLSGGTVIWTDAAGQGEYDRTWSLEAREEGGATRLIVRRDGAVLYNGLDSTAGRPMGTKHGMSMSKFGTNPAIYVPAFFDDFSITG